MANKGVRRGIGIGSWPTVVARAPISAARSQSDTGGPVPVLPAEYYYFASTTTIIAPKGTYRFIISSGGGGGGGTVGTVSNGVHSGGGGAGAGTGDGTLTSDGITPLVITIGAGGTGISGATGNPGNNSSITGGGQSTTYGGDSANGSGPGTAGSNTLVGYGGVPAIGTSFSAPAAADNVGILVPGIGGSLAASSYVFTGWGSASGGWGCSGGGAGAA